MGKVIIARADDAGDIVLRIKELLAQLPDDQPVEISEDVSESVEVWEAVVILFVLTDGALADDSLVEFTKRAAGNGLPVVPVVEKPDYPFYDLPDSLSVLSERNAVSLEPADGPTLLESVEGYLGLTSFVSRRKVFISYRRSDGREQAEEIEAYLWAHRIPPFLDTNQIEGGAVVQERIVQEIQDKDLVLLVDTPDVASSKWVAEEIKEALLRRIPVCVVTTKDVLHFPLLGAVPRVRWNAADPQNLERIRMMVLRSIAARDSFDRRVARTLHQMASLKKITLKNLAPRQLLLSQSKLRWFVEYEDAPVSLERLHRLYIGYKKEKRCKGAIFVGGEQPIQTLTRDAVTWARGKSTLEVVHLPELYRTLDGIFP